MQQATTSKNKERESAPVGKKASCQIMDPPNLLAAKAPATMRGVSSIIADADRAVKALDNDYVEWAEEQLGVLEKAVQDVMANKPKRSDSLRSLHRIAFDMRGLAGNFDYPLITLICANLCKVIDMEPVVTAKWLQVLQAHVDAVRTVVKLQVHGDGGETGRALIQELATASALFTATE